jgi:solute carrier family 34 (sodium-dependent phosphate cotransporter)
MTNNGQPGFFKGNLILVTTAVFGLVLFMFSIDFLTYSLAQFNNELARGIFMSTQNPFVGLFIGLLMTALIQSSSTVSAMIVAVVASGNLSLAQAVPLIMGANIGTTLTSTLVAFSYIMKRKAFRKALSAGVLHDFFNIITVIILLPLEVYFGLLSTAAQFITNSFFVIQGSQEEGYGFQGIFLREGSILLDQWLVYPLFSLIIAVLLLIGSIKILSSLAYKSLITPNFNKISKHIFDFPYRAFGYGLFFTAAVQSSTVTTSLMVTAVATGKVALKRVFPFIIGANIGTTVTASIAAIYKTEAAISIAIVHLLFNLIGAVVFLPFPSLRQIPVTLAKKFAKQTVKTKVVGFGYILLAFFIIPFFLIYFNQSDPIIKSDSIKASPATHELVLKDKVPH